VWEDIGQTIADVVANIIAFFQPLLDFIATFVQGIIDFFTPLVDYFAQVFALIGALFEAGWAALMVIVQFWIGVIVGVITAIFSPIVEWFAGVFEAISTSAVAENWTNTWNAVTGFFNGIWETNIQAIKIVVGIITGLIDGFLKSVSKNWKNSWDAISKVFSDIWNGITDIAKGAINGIIDIVNGLMKAIHDTAVGLSNLTGGTIKVPPAPKLPHLASGGILTGPTAIMAGEAGREAIVPLNRNLSQVDPSVRGLSAVAQGLGGPSVTIAPGAVVINTVSRDPALIASMTIDRLVANLPV
jgi:hypothetical protein